MSLVNVGIVFDYEKMPNISQEDIEEVKKKISKIENELSTKLPKYLKLLEHQEIKEDYFEIHLPIFDYGITIMMSMVSERYLISVLDQRNSRVYGNLLLDGYKCVDINYLKKLGTWSSWKRLGMSIFKPDQ